MVDECIQPISSNPDIAGIGIRVNFYATILLIALTPENEYTGELLDGIYKNSVINGLGLVITAVIQTIEKQLDLYHAIFVMQIIFSLNFVYGYGQRLYRYNQTDFRLKVFIGVQTFTTVVFTVWLLYVWIKGSNFGSQQACNHLVKYVLLFIDIRATVTWLRVFFIIYLVITACALLFNFGVIVSAHMKQLRADIYEKLPDIMVPTESPPPIQSSAPQSQGQSEKENDSGRTALKCVKLSVIPAVYGVATLELMVHSNRSIIQSGENTWGFGQIIAIILTLGIFIDVVGGIRDWQEAKKQRRSKAHNPEV